MQPTRYIEMLNKDENNKIYRNAKQRCITTRYIEMLNKDVNNEIYRKAKQRCKQRDIWKG